VFLQEHVVHICMYRLCSPGRIRPGLRAQRAMKSVWEMKVGANAAAGTPRLRFGGADECVRPYMSFLGIADAGVAPA